MSLLPVYAIAFGEGTMSQLVAPRGLPLTAPGDELRVLVTASTGFALLMTCIEGSYECVPLSNSRCTEQMWD